MVYKENPVLEFARQNNINLFRDTKSDRELIPSFELLDEAGVAGQRVDESGAFYTSYKINYSDAKDIVHACRTIAEIPPGGRTELAYWTKAAGSKILDVHRGRGNFIIGDPRDGITQVYPFDANSVSELILSPECFYTIQAAADSHEPLIVSGFYEPPPDWERLEISLQPGQNTVVAPEGIIHVPSDFMAACEVK